MKDSVVRNKKYMNEKFWPKVSKTNRCWNWTAYKRNGYGQLTMNGKHYQAHRISFEYSHGKIPKGMVLDHFCRDRSCVNPDHLRVTDHKQNILVGISKSAINARKTHCKRGHKFTRANTQILFDKKLRRSRRCLECKRLDMREIRHKRRFKMETRIRRPNHVLADWGALRRHLLTQLELRQKLMGGDQDRLHSSYLGGSVDTLKETLLIMEKMDDQDKE